MAEHLISTAEASADLLACAAFISEDIKNHDVHASAMMTIVPRYLERGDVDLAAELANTVDDPFTRDKLLSAVAEKCASLDDDEYAMQLAEAIEDIGQRSQTIEKIAIQKGAKGETEKALAFADRIAHPEYIYADLALRLAAASDDAGSNAMLDRIEYPAASVSALQAIAQLEINSGEMEKAAGSLEAAAEEAAAIEHDEERIRALCEIGSLYTLAEKPAEAVKCFEIAAEQSEALTTHRDFFIANASLGMMQAGDADAADGALEMLRDKTQAASCLVGFSKEYRKRGELNDAMEELEEAYAIFRSQKDSEVRDSKAKFAVHRLIAVEFAENGSLERAVEIAREIADPAEKNAALTQIAQVIQLAGDDEKAREIIAAIPEDPDRLYALLGMSDQTFQSGEKDAAVKLLEDARILAETIPNLGPRSAALAEIAGRLFRCGHADKAQAAAHEDLEYIYSMTNAGSQAAALANLSPMYTSGGLEVGAFESEILESIVRRSQI
jgi:tetratricopeptide (TPR) repeat protein